MEEIFQGVEMRSHRKPNTMVISAKARSILRFTSSIRQPMNLAGALKIYWTPPPLRLPSLSRIHERQDSQCLNNPTLSSMYNSWNSSACPNVPNAANTLVTLDRSVVSPKLSRSSQLAPELPVLHALTKAAPGSVLFDELVMMPPSRKTLPDTHNETQKREALDKPPCSHSHLEQSRLMLPG